MHILRYRRAGSPGVRVGVLAGGRVAELEGVPFLGSLWSLPVDRIREKAEDPGGEVGTLENPVVRGLAAMVSAAGDPL